ncbi:MAG: Peptidase [Candidatus Tokpelaia hoelldobleri]|uniref:Murein endopeptidase K n=1 Tax=Candidatus Tokpelaia hoelldobleri TaxID=1902579 RepID=A0A1U9JTC3_9HYPH|nr:MAG: Peptidase [Candidatus Tokpelaia hoelldoblerii]
MSRKSGRQTIQAHFSCRAVLFSMLACFCPLFSFSAAQAETRSLRLYYVHTRERAEIVFKKDGRYVQSGLKKLNYFLRDWRRNEPTVMDPHLFDVVWQIYRLSGSNDYIHVVSAYRAPATNSMLRARSSSSGVAKNSQHTLGKAMDFYIPDVTLSRLRQIGMKQQSGGVGYYPASGSPFIHVDVGNVRHWPRMNRHDLLALFPNGRTIHIPSDGVPLSGYVQAMADYKARKGLPPQIMVAEAKENKQNGNPFPSLFGRKQDKVTPLVPQVKPQTPQEETMIAQLPEHNVPVPGFAGQADIEEIEDETAPLVAENSVTLPRNIPVPDTKPFTVAAIKQKTPETALAAIAAGLSPDVPIPGVKPLGLAATAPAAQAAPLALALVEQPLPQAVPLPQLRPVETPVQKKDAVGELIKQIEVIPVPADDFSPAATRPAQQGRSTLQLVTMDTDTGSKTGRLNHQAQNTTHRLRNVTQQAVVGEAAATLSGDDVLPLPQAISAYGWQHRQDYAD